MDRLERRVAVVTGAASGIGFALAERFAAEGMRVVLADIEEAALRAADERLSGSGATTLAVRTDVSLSAEVEALADAAYDAFGAVHIVCNNAGVAGTNVRTGGIWNRDVLDWQWLLGVNLFGVIHGVHAFLPRMLAAGEEGHLVNTASLAGIVPANSIYSVSKHGVVALSEALRMQLAAAKAKVGVSVLCPGVVRTNILDAERNRPARLKPKASSEATTAQVDEAARENLAAGIEPSVVAGAVVSAVREGRFVVVPMHDDRRQFVRDAVLDRARSIADQV